jgi:hypothetical protein
MKTENANKEIPTGKSKKEKKSTSGKAILKKTKGSESKTWRFTPEPWVIKANNGQTMLTMSNETFTIVRASLATGGYRCYMTLNSYWTTCWGRTHYSDNPGVTRTVDILNAQGGLLLNWNLGATQTECGWNNNGISNSQDFSPDIYDIIASANVTIRGASFYQC